jgi:cysteine desulfurase
VITTQTDHKCVLDSCRSLQQRGFEVTYLPVSAGGCDALQRVSDRLPQCPRQRCEKPGLVD